MAGAPRFLVAFGLGTFLLAELGRAESNRASCNPPSFAFKWIGPASVQLVAKAKPAGWFRVWIQEGRSSNGRVVNVNDQRPIYAADADAGKAYTVDLTGMDLITSAGRVRIWYLADDPCSRPEATPTSTSASIASSISIWTMLKSSAAQGRAEKTTVEAVSPPPDGAVRAAATEAVLAANAPLRATTGAASRSSTAVDGSPAEADDRFELIDGVVALEMHHLSIDVGSVFSMRADGTFEANPELALAAISRWSSTLAGAMDIRISSLNVPTGTTSGSSATSDSNGASSGPTVPALASSSSNVLEGAGRFIYLPFGDAWSTPLFGAVLGAGVRSLRSDVLKLEANTFVGLRLQVPGYNAGNPADSLANTRGFVEAGYLRDRYWKNDLIQSDQRNRYYIESQLEIPAVGGEHVRFLFRVRASKPVQFDGPSELRLSALLTIDPAVFRTLFGVPK